MAMIDKYNGIGSVCKTDISNKNYFTRHLLCHKPSECEITECSSSNESCHPCFKCDACGINSENKRKLLKHLRSQHSDLFRGSSNKRQRAFSSRRKRNQEDYEKILVHDGKKGSEEIKKLREISECPHCKAHFSLKTNLLKHMKTIHNASDHEITVYEEIKLKIGHRCGACDKVFSLRKNLYQHLRKTHGKTDIGRYGPNSGGSIRLICDACGVGFGEKKSLTRHLRMKHSVDVTREKKKVAMCTLCNSTFSHFKSLYKHERKFHGAGYKKIVKNNVKESDGGSKTVNEKFIDDYPYLKAILPVRTDYKLTHFTWMKSDKDADTTGSWFKAKLYFFCDSKEDVNMWKENYELINKLCLRVLSFPRPRTPGVMYKGRFRCHHNTMPKKGAKPNAKHTACSAVLTVTLLQPQPQNTHMKALIFLKNTHNHRLDDPASLKYRTPIHEVKEKFLKMFEAKKTVSQALAIHKADLEAEYGPNTIQSIVNDRAFMPDTRWAYGLYYSSYKKKRAEDIQHAVNGGSKPDNSPTPVAPRVRFLETVAVPTTTLPHEQQIQPEDPFRQLLNIFQSICREISDRCTLSANFFHHGLQEFITSYKYNCVSDDQLLAALQMFGKCYSNAATNCRVRQLPVENFELTNENISASPVFHSFPKYSSTPMVKPTVTQSRCTLVQPTTSTTTVAMQRDLLSSSSSHLTLTLHESQNNMMEARSSYHVDTKFDESILYPMESRQNITSNSWLSGMSAEYGMF